MRALVHPLDSLETGPYGRHGEHMPSPHFIPLQPYRSSNAAMRAACLLMMIAGCSSSSPSSTPQKPAHPRDGDTLVMASSIDPDNLNPIVAPYALSGYLIDLINPGLVKREMTPDGLV